MSVILGCIADDSTGATDLANMLVKNGMRTVQLIGVPNEDQAVPEADAIVLALKSRSNPADEAASMSLAALEWLKKAGARQFFFKYCSTFDSTDQGNIGPVADALLDALGSDFTIACPAFPATGRSIYNGYLFVGDQLLSESGMKDHPLNPMTDSNLVRVLQRQTKNPVGLVGHQTIKSGADAISAAFDQLRDTGARFAIVDAIGDDDLYKIGGALADMPLITGGSGIALGLPENYRKAGLIDATSAPAEIPATGKRLIIAGSCSVATRDQIDYIKKLGWPCFEIDPVEIAGGRDIAAAAIDWAGLQAAQTPVLIYSSADPQRVREMQERFGVEKIGTAIENCLGEITQELVASGAGQLVVAGGETSGAVVKALGIQGLHIGPEIDPGVPWTAAIRKDGGDKPLALALKSGNFGTEDFMEKAFVQLET